MKLSNNNPHQLTRSTVENHPPAHQYLIYSPDFDEIRYTFLTRLLIIFSNNKSAYCRTRSLSALSNNLAGNFINTPALGKSILAT